MSNNYGVFALILGLVGICCFGIVLGPIAIILGTIGIRKDDENALAIMGLIFGIIATIFWIIGIILLINYLASQ